jgi:hypothetical protein
LTNTNSALDSLKGEHYIRGRRAALAGKPPSSSVEQPGTLEHEDFARGAKSVADERFSALHAQFLLERRCIECSCGGRGLCRDIA